VLNDVFHANTLLNQIKHYYLSNYDDDEQFHFQALGLNWLYIIDLGQSVTLIVIQMC